MFPTEDDPSYRRCYLYYGIYLLCTVLLVSGPSLVCKFGLSNMGSTIPDCWTVFQYRADKGGVCCTLHFFISDAQVTSQETQSAIPFWACLSPSDKVSFCDHILSIVRASLRKQFLQTTSPKSLTGFWPNFTGMILGRSSFKVVQWFQSIAHLGHRS